MVIEQRKPLHALFQQVVLRGMSVANDFFGIGNVVLVLRHRVGSRDAHCWSS
jgi:hypothetical protein